jgi:hypothetical protein
VNLPYSTQLLPKLIFSHVAVVKFPTLNTLAYNETMNRFVLKVSKLLKDALLMGSRISAVCRQVCGDPDKECPSHLATRGRLYSRGRR